MCGGSGRGGRVVTVSIWTDGGCYPNPGPGGWAYVTSDGREESGGRPMTTNNQMELMAVIRGLLAGAPRSHVIVWSDSQYIVRAFNEGWLKRWQGNGWRTRERGTVANQDLWVLLAEAVDRH